MGYVQHFLLYLKNYSQHLIQKIGYITDKEEKFRHQWNNVKICNNLYIIDILIGLEELEKIEKDLEKMEFIHVLNNNDIKYNYGFLLRKRTDQKLYRRRKV